MVLLNTCHIREKAAEKLYSDLGRLAPLKAAKAARGDAMILAVTGCVAQAEGHEILRRAKPVDLVVGPQNYHELPALIAQVKAGARPVATEFLAETKFGHLPPRGKSPVSAFLSVQEGCDKFCSFCVVPYTRGSEFSRPADSILDEARALVAGGAAEIVLLGQNVNAYHGLSDDGSVWSLARLIRALADIPGLLRIRYTTSHLLDMGDDLIATHGEVEVLMPFLHLPVQSGSDRVLKDMNRRHSTDDYRRIVERLRQARPDLGLSSDFIVGFPGESDADFTATLDLVREIGFAAAYSFKYSPRPGTPAASRDDQVPEARKDERLASLQALIAAQQKEFNAGFVGRSLPVLFERAGRHPGQLVGRSPWQHGVHAEAPASLLGRVADIRIADIHANSLAGAAVTEAA
jgi:tRNA-2-methylthio-N6-dimethylallyladenosine synthase